MIGSEGVPARDIEHAPVIPDNSQPYPPRLWSRREVAVVPVLPDFKAAADEGSYFVGTNPTLGTGIAGIFAAGFSAIAGTFGFLNKSGPGGARTYLDYIRLILTAIPTAGTRLDMAIIGDTIARATGGTAVTMWSPNLDAIDQSANTQVLYQPTLANQSPNPRQLARAVLKGATPVVGDEYLLVFGTVEKAAAVVASASVAGRYVIPLPPVVLGGGGIQSATLHLWSPSSSAAPSFEFEVGLLER